MVKPTSVIAPHADEAATKDGKPIPGTKTEISMKESKVPVHLPLSGVTVEFDSNSNRVAGC